MNEFIEMCLLVSKGAPNIPMNWISMYLKYLCKFFLLVMMSIELCLNLVIWFNEEIPWEIFPGEISGASSFGALDGCESVERRRWHLLPWVPSTCFALDAESQVAFVWIIWLSFHCKECLTLLLLFWCIVD